MTAQTPDPNRHGASPLGGRVHNPRRLAIARQWSGYVAMIKVCPSCGEENVERNIFCARCGEPISQVTPQPATKDSAGRELLRYRLASEQWSLQRNRVQIPQGGSGTIILGAMLVALGSWISTDFIWQSAIWLVGMSLAIFGIWKLRTDAVALRNWGIILSVFAVGLLALFVNNSVADSSRDEVTPTAEAPGAGAVEPVATPSLGFAGSVPMYRGDLAHTGIQPGPNPVGAPTLAWRFDTGGEVYSSPVIADSRLFVASKSGYLFALDATTGNELWRFQLSDYVVRSTPAVHEGIVYIGAGFNLFAIDAATGVEQWRFPMRYAGQSSPVVTGDAVLVTSQEGWVYRIDRESGEMAWRLNTEGLPFGAVATNGAVAIVATDAGIVTSVDVESGRQLWRADTGESIFATPAIGNNATVVVSRDGTTRAINLETGKVVWTANTGGVQPAAVEPGTGYVAGSDGAVSSINAADGAFGWVFPTGRTVASAPVISGDLVIVGTGRNLVALNKTNGQQVWNYLAGGNVETSPAVIGGYVFFGSDDGFVYAVTGTG
jgi:outer membrane protein assembly factor BamB